jgi:polyphosphate kinase
MIDQTQIDSDFFINRELSWLDFNLRVLFQTSRKEIPLIERLKFLGITCSNLDEFIMVRYCAIINKLAKGIEESEISGLFPDEEQQIVFKAIIKFKDIQYKCFKHLLDELNENNVKICKCNDLNKNEISIVENIFDEEIFPLLTPVAYDVTTEFPKIKSKQLNLVISVEEVSSKLNVLCLIPIDSNLKRIYSIVSNKHNDIKYILLEDIIFTFLNKIFVNKKILAYGSMRLLREADIELEHNSDIYLVDRMKNTILQREFSKPIFMELSNNTPKQIEKLLRKTFELPKDHIYKTDELLDLSVFESKPISISELEYTHFNSQYPEELIGEMDMFTAIDSNDIIIHHPYESFEAVVKFLEHAADDENVLSIKQTLYRVSSENSPIIDALCKAAKNGKQVVVLLEVKARFDEEKNIQLVEKLKMSGCIVIYGFENLKTHCKFSLIVRRAAKGNKLYSHISTGNYNERTSQFYTDLSYFTSSYKIGYDLLIIFNILSGFSDPVEKLKKLIISPYSLRNFIYTAIDREIDNVNNGGNGLIIFKLNSLSDEGIITKLYEASEHGVKIKIICRGINSMKQINSNIEIRSVVGRFLEHSRVYMFYNNNKAEYFISSADMLTRNLDKRVEILVPITDKEVKSKLENILFTYFKDYFNTFMLRKEEWHKLRNENNNFNVHDYFMNEALENYKLRTIPKISFKRKK